MIDCRARSRPTVKVSRAIDAPPGVVYSAFTDADLLWRWFAPHGHELAEADIDPRVGGKFRTVATGPNGSRHVTLGRFRELVPGERIVLTWTQDGPEPNTNGAEALVTVTLRERAGGTTELTLLVEQEEVDHDRKPCERGVRERWDEGLEQFATAMADIVAGAFRGAVVESFGVRQKTTNALAELLADHLGRPAEPDLVSIVSDHYPVYLEVGFQAALDEFLSAPGRTYRILGVDSPSVMHRSLDSGELALATVLAEPSLASAPVVFAAPEFVLRPSGWDDAMPCLQQGLVLFADAEGPGAFWLRGPSNRRLHLDLLHVSGDRARRILTDLRVRASVLNPYRGQVVSIRSGPSAGPEVEFRPRPDFTEADQVILPPGLLEEIEEHSIGVIRAHEALAASGRHFKRGLLLHGRPGTGKTHTIRYLISQMPGVTVVVLSGDKMIEGVELVHSMIDLIVPAVIVLDDVDFIAEDRSRPGLSGTREDLFALLELLDGIGEDADLLFVLTTNRPNTLERAIAARPGRIDQAVEVPLPDGDCRRRLLELYTRELALGATAGEVATFVERTEGVTASFIREAVRRAAVVSVLREGIDVATPVDVSGPGLLQALDELLDPANALTPLLLGAEPEHAKPMLAVVVEPADQPASES